MKRQSLPATNLLLFWGVTALLAMVTLWLWQNHFVNDEALRQWARLIAVFDSDALHLENLGVIYPHAPFYALALFHYLGPLDSPAATYLVTVLFAAGLFVLWNHHLKRAGHSLQLRVLLILLVLPHPALLWPATSGSLETISLLFFYLLYISTLRMTREQDIHSFIMVGVVLALFYFADELTIYLFIALIPLLAMMVPRNILLGAPLSAYVILATPLMVVILGWFYFNWIFYGSPLAFINDPVSGFLGGRHMIDRVQWLRQYGGEWLMPLVIAFVMTLVCYPAIVLLLGQIRENRSHFSAAMVLLLHPVVAVGLATYDYFLEHPMEIVSLVVAGVMAEVTVFNASRRRSRLLLISLMIVGLVGGWGCFLYSPSPQMQRWASALYGPIEPLDHSGDIALGQWLTGQRKTTLMDDRSGYRVIVARGDAESMILPFSDLFKIELRRNAPTVALVAVPDPLSETGARDAINQRWPTFFQSGAKGYQLIYDYKGWRIWSRRL